MQQKKKIKTLLKNIKCSMEMLMEQTGLSAQSVLRCMEEINKETPISTSFGRPPAYWIMED